MRRRGSAGRADGGAGRRLGLPGPGPARSDVRARRNARLKRIKRSRKMSENNQELSITRFIDAPPETVYRVYTERTAEWWVPKPWMTGAVEWDLRTGGRMYTEMRSPEGATDGGEGVFLEVVPNERLLWTNAFTPGWQGSEQRSVGN